jgi:hypothetical protein
MVFVLRSKRHFWIFLYGHKKKEIMNTRLTGEYTRGFTGQELTLPRADLMTPYQGVDAAQMMYQRPMVSRNMGRQVPNISFGGKLRTIENPTLRADIALNHMTPEAVVKSRDLRATATQREFLSDRDAPRMKEALAPVPIPTNPLNADPRVLAGYLTQVSPDDSYLRGPKRGNRESNAIEGRIVQNASLNAAMGMNYVDASERRMPASAKSMFSTATIGHSPEAQEARSYRTFNRSMYGTIPLNTYNGARGVTNLQHVPGTSAPLPLNSRR